MDFQSITYSDDRKSDSEYMERSFIPEYPWIQQGKNE